ncbi:MAG: class I SAM-dependent methyltransferase [Sphingobacteriales bacterium]|nr:MAG: class I SAM-dependent methyltransferase [Sphingobacteriales bacterium]
MSASYNLQDAFGNIDIYLFDQLLKGTYANSKTVLDAGCGTGRNLLYFLKNGFDVYGVDQNPEAIAEMKHVAKQYVAKGLDANFLVSPVEDLPFENHKFDLVISSAVLHFAESRAHFDAMLNEIWRVLKPGGYLFCRLASNIGIESAVIATGNGRYLLPDDSERFLVNQEMLLELTSKLGAELTEPIKTTNVQNLRCMTTWCLRKQPGVKLGF